MEQNKTSSKATSRKGRLAKAGGEDQITGGKAWYCWMQFGEIIVGKQTFKHGDPQLLDKNDPATQHLEYLGEE